MTDKLAEIQDRLVQDVRTIPAPITAMVEVRQDCHWLVSELEREQASAESAQKTVEHFDNLMLLIGHDDYDEAIMDLIIRYVESRSLLNLDQGGFGNTDEELDQFLADRKQEQSDG